MTIDEVYTLLGKVELEVKQDLAKIWDSLEKHRDKLPNWAVWYISFLSAVAASAVTLLFKG